MRTEQIGDATLYLGDCADLLLGLKIDAIVTDPPYGLGESNQKKHMSRGQLAAPRDYGGCRWDELPASQELIDLMRRMSPYQIIFGGNYFNLPPTKCWLVWNKLNGDNDFADCEIAWTNLDMAVRRIRWLWNGMLRAEKGTREHPTQKPVGVMTWVIEKLPADVAVICDPFMGSGTTGVSCAMLGKTFIGIERDARYFDIACRRIEAAYKQPRLFTEPTPKPVQEKML